MERKIKLVPYRVYKYCPKCPGIMEQCTHGTVITSCGTSTFALTTSAYASYTSQIWNHRCNKCGHGENYDKSYPYIDYIEDGELG